MATQRVLVTGGAGFIGSHLVDRLVTDGNSVTVADALVPQVHKKPPTYLNPKAKFLKGDIKETRFLQEALADIDAVFHFAAAVGVSQSMYEIARYVEENSLATARLLDLLARKEHAVKKLVVASSMSVYGEGLYRCQDHGPVWPGLRPEKELRARDWEQHCPHCGKSVTPVATPEWKPKESMSVYAISKRDQEEYSLVVGRTYGLPTTALRFFNVYGPRQSLSNPYTGVGAIFASRLKAGRPPTVYEDGLQTRDFVNVADAAEACQLAAARSAADYEAINVGTGRATSLVELARGLARFLGKKIAPAVSFQFRPGDIRHCYADTSKAERLLGFRARVELDRGLGELSEWAAVAQADDRFDEAQRELDSRGLLQGAR